MASNPVLVQTPKAWSISIGNSDAQNWKLLKDNTVTTPVGPGASGAKITQVIGTSTDSGAKNVQLALVRQGSVTCTSASPGVISWAGHTLAVGDQFFLSGTAVPTGTTAFLPYFVISTGFSAGVSFQFSATAGGAAINTSSTGTAVIAFAVRILTTVPVAITAGTDGATAGANFFNTTYLPALPVDNDGQRYVFLESTDFLAVQSVTTVTANKIINVTAIGANF